MKNPLAALPLLALLGLPAPAPAAEPEAPPWAVTVRAGAFLFNSPGMPGHPAGPDVEASLSRTIYELVSVEVSAGHYRVKLSGAGTGTEARITPIGLSLRLFGPADLGFEPYAVGGLGAALTQLSGGAAAAPLTTLVAYHVGLGVRRRFGAVFFVGAEARYVFLDTPSREVAALGQIGRLDGVRLSALAGLLF